MARPSPGSSKAFPPAWRFLRGVIDHELARRQQGYGSGGRMKIEKDTVTILGGVMGGKTTGAPIALQILNADHVKWKGKAVEPMTAPRPGHADLTGAIKYGYRDLRPALERASARETAMRVAAGAVCKHFLQSFGIVVGGYVRAIGAINADLGDMPYLERFERAEQSDVRCPDQDAAGRMRASIEAIMHAQDTLGGILEIIALGVPAGLGSYAQWDHRLEARLAMAVLSVQAMKGVEIGDAFENAGLPGTKAHDSIRLSTPENQKGEDGQDTSLTRETNRAGGLEGGVTNGQPIVIRVAMKPIATTLKPQRTVDLGTGQESPTKYERSDFCPVPRAVPILEAMTAFILADALIEKLGGDSLSEMQPRFEIPAQGNPPGFANGQFHTCLVGLIMGHIFIYGPPGSGKTSIGKVLSKNLSLPFVDLDDRTEQAAGMDISQMISERGEAAFRDLEFEELKKIISELDSVVALGGGTLLRDENRTLAETSGSVVYLDANLSTLLEHLAGNAQGRPLLQGDLTNKLTALLRVRADHYASFQDRVKLDGQALEQAAWQIQIELGRYHLRSMGAGYDAFVRSGGLDSLGEMLRARGLQKPIVVTDKNVAKFHADRALVSLQGSNYRPNLVTLPAGEFSKTLDSIAELWRCFLEAGLDRRSTVVALGGGVVGDLAGFAAATFMRGVNWVVVPTTLLAIVDSSLGGKTGFDLPEGKNLVGSFHPPRLVLADPQVLETLPEAELCSGLAEVVKHGIIADPHLFDLTARGLEVVKSDLLQIARRAMAVKIKIIEEDPYEQGLRAALNLGHTVGHAVELVSGYRLRHGEAVAIGMVAEARLAEILGLAGKGLSERIAGALSSLVLPIQIPSDLPHPEIIHAMQFDKKKAAGLVRFALPVEIGRVKVNVEVKDLELLFEED